MKKWSHLNSTKADWELKLLDKERRRVFTFILVYFILTIIVLFTSFVAVSMLYLPPDVSVETPKTAVVVTTTPPVGELTSALVSHYTSSPEETDASPCISANGTDICKLFAEGKNTCASNVYPFGTELYVEAHGYCTVRDRMNSRFATGYVDWYMGHDKQGAIERGIGVYDVVVFK